MLSVSKLIAVCVMIAESTFSIFPQIIALVACSAVVASIQVHGGDHGHHEKPNFPTYKFGYGVRDQYTHDYKGQWEHRDGDVVKGQYTIDEPDGTHRLVEYSSDAHNGLKVFVRRKGLAHHPHGESYNNFDLSY